jgi:hypothetical protein
MKEVTLQKSSLFMWLVSLSDWLCQTFELREFEFNADQPVTWATGWKAWAALL